MMNKDIRIQLRNSMVELLQRMGYVSVDLKENPSRFINKSAGIYRPRALFLEPRLRDLNQGDAWYFFPEDRSLGSLERLGHPRTEKTPAERREELDYILRRGWEFKYQLNGADAWDCIHVLDYEKPERNALTVSTCWPVNLNDVHSDVWDIVLCINEIPMLTLLIDDDFTHSLLQTDQTILDQIPAENGLLNLYTQYCLVTDGEHMYVGTPDTPGCEFQEWLPQSAPQTERCLQTVEYFCHPKRLLEIFRTYTELCHPAYLHREGQEPVRHLVSPQLYQQVEQVAACVLKACLDDVQCVGHVLMSDDEYAEQFMDLLSEKLVHHSSSLILMGMDYSNPEEILEATRKGPSVVIAEDGLSAAQCQRLIDEDPELHVIQVLSDSTDTFGDCLLKIPCPC